MTENRKSLIEYRLTQARDSIREADVLNYSGMSRRIIRCKLDTESETDWTANPVTSGQSIRF